MWLADTLGVMSSRQAAAQSASCPSGAPPVCLPVLLSMLPPRWRQRSALMQRSSLMLTTSVLTSTDRADLSIWVSVDSGRRAATAAAWCPWLAMRTDASCPLAIVSTELCRQKGQLLHVAGGRGGGGGEGGGLPATGRRRSGRASSAGAPGWCRGASGPPHTWQPGRHGSASRCAGSAGRIAQVKQDPCSAMFKLAVMELRAPCKHTTQQPGHAPEQRQTTLLAASV